MNVWAKARTPIPSNRTETRPVVFYAKDLTQAEQGVPVPVVFGTQRVAGVYITPIWRFRNHPVYSQVGK